MLKWKNMRSSARIPLKTISVSENDARLQKDTQNDERASRPHSDRKENPDMVLKQHVFSLNNYNKL